ncbi:uncharacterized PE-PGRS family protein PE_PGRS54-like [Oppia nitens]|uniref:uncharacterized PE-PGRS family protein PE_PGRS54-like n=1 Tax=Oppia nitens TaxID=1686743 RepID=UPI0023D9CE84|nr:uncharacterized PE-PGRS family protein PE_PGRS54-like [Oppia nitens]
MSKFNIFCITIVTLIVITTEIAGLTTNPTARQLKDAINALENFLSHIDNKNSVKSGNTGSSAPGDDGDDGGSSSSSSSSAGAGGGGFNGIQVAVGGPLIGYLGQQQQLGGPILLNNNNNNIKNIPALSPNGASLGPLFGPVVKASSGSSSSSSSIRGWDGSGLGPLTGELNSNNNRGLATADGGGGLNGLLRAAAQSPQSKFLAGGGPAIALPMIAQPFRYEQWSFGPRLGNNDSIGKPVQVPALSPNGASLGHLFGWPARHSSGSSSSIGSGGSGFGSLTGEPNSNNVRGLAGGSGGDGDRIIRETGGPALISYRVVTKPSGPNRPVYVQAVKDSSSSSSSSIGSGGSGFGSLTGEPNSNNVRGLAGGSGGGGDRIIRETGGPVLISYRVVTKPSGPNRSVFVQTVKDSSSSSSSTGSGGSGIGPLTHEPNSNNNRGLATANGGGGGGRPGDDGSVKLVSYSEHLPNPVETVYRYDPAADPNSRSSRSSSSNAGSGGSGLGPLTGELNSNNNRGLAADANNGGGGRRPGDGGSGQLVIHSEHLPNPVVTEYRYDPAADPNSRSSRSSSSNAGSGGSGLGPLTGELNSNDNRGLATANGGGGGRGPGDDGGVGGGFNGLQGGALGLVANNNRPLPVAIPN